MYIIYIHLIILFEKSFPSCRPSLAIMFYDAIASDTILANSTSMNDFQNLFVNCFAITIGLKDEVDIRKTFSLFPIRFYGINYN